MREWHCDLCGYPERQCACHGQVDMIEHPPHYCQGEIECIQAIRAALTPEEFRGFCKGNALAYLWRERHKGGDTDMAKATWYLKKATEAR
jgi:hypothetical protein